MTIKELKHLLSGFNNKAVVKINGSDITVSYSQDQDGKWTINISTQVTNNACGDKGSEKH